jgi:TRAP-type C4-dicarboxylate transport system permease small subunit
MRINLHVEAAVTGASMAFVYGTGVVFAVFALVLLLRDLWRLLRGQLSDSELVMVKETEEQGEIDALQSKLAGEQATRHGLPDK